MLPSFGVARVSSWRRLALRREHLDSFQSVLAQHSHLGERLIHHAGEDLAIVGDRTLTYFLRVSDVQGRRLSKLVMRMTAFCLDYVHNLLTSDGDLAANGVLGLNHILAQTVQNRLVCAPSVW